MTFIHSPTVRPHTSHPVSQAYEPNLAFKALDFVGNKRSPADLAGFLQRHPQIEHAGAHPRYLVFGPAVAHALSRNTAQNAPADPYINLIHTQDTPTGISGRNFSVNVTSSWKEETTNHVSILPLSEIASKLNAGARLANVTTGQAPSIVLVPHPAVQLVLAVADLFNRKANYDGTPELLIQLFLKHPAHEETGVWKKLIRDTVNSLETDELRSRAQTRIDNLIKKTCATTPSLTRTNDLCDLLS